MNTPSQWSFLFLLCLTICVGGLACSEDVPACAECIEDAGGDAGDDVDTDSDTDAADTETGDTDAADTGSSEEDVDDDSTCGEPQDPCESVEDCCPGLVCEWDSCSLL